MKNRNLLIINFLCIFMLSCGGIESGLKAKSTSGGPNSANDEVSSLDDLEVDAYTIVELPLSFETIKTQILEDNCINCHIGKHSVFSLHSLVQLYSDDILNRMTTTNLLKRMPPSRPPISPELIGLFKAWVEIGTPEFEEELVYPIEKRFLKKQNN